MNITLSQMRCLREVIRQDFSLTRAAEALHTSQPGVSKTVMDCELQLGFEFFNRQGKRFKGLTVPAKAIWPQIEKVLNEYANLQSVVHEFSDPQKGHFIVATTHTQARYLMPFVVAKFRKKFPDVKLTILQSTPSLIAQMVLNDQADVAFATEKLAFNPLLDAQAVYQWTHQIVYPSNHALGKIESIQLGDICQFPLITYDGEFAGRQRIDYAFAALELEPDIILEAIDSDVIRTYVEMELGVGILAEMALIHSSQLQESKLEWADAGHLFGVNTTYAAYKKDRHIKLYEQCFIDLLHEVAIEMFEQIKTVV